MNRIHHVCAHCGAEETYFYHSYTLEGIEDIPDGDFCPSCDAYFESLEVAA
jgi:hypothetical protein